MKFQLIIIMLVIFNHFYAQPLPLKNLSNSSQHSHSSNLIFGTQDQLYVFWIEGDNRIHSRSFSNHTWSNTNQIYLSDPSSTIEELNVSSNGNSICLYWTENNVRASIMTGNFAGDSLTYIDTVYQTAHSIERIISRQGNYLGWLEKISNFSSRAGLNVMTVSNENISLIDSCDIWFDFTMAPDDSGKLYVFWCKYGFDIHFVSLIDSLNWSPATSIVSSYSFKDLDCTFNPIHQNFNISIAGNLFTGPYSNGIVYVEGRDSSWSAFEEIMPVGWSSPFSKFDISEFPQVLFQADGTCLTVFQNTFNGQSTTDRNIYRAQKNNSGGWTVEKDLFPEPVLLNSSGLNIDDSLFCTFEKGNDVYIGGNELIVNIQKEKNIENISYFELYQNYPNPFNPSTTIEFDLPKTSEVSLKVFNILGEEVATLLSASLLSGSHSVEWDASDLASGVYLYRLQAGDYVETRKMVLMR